MVKIKMDRRKIRGLCKFVQFDRPYTIRDNEEVILCKNKKAAHDTPYVLGCCIATSTYNTGHHKGDVLIEEQKILTCPFRKQYQKKK